MAQRGEVYPLLVTFYDAPGGAVADASSVSVSILFGGSVVYGPFTGSAIARDAVGRYRYMWTIPLDAALGDYTIEWAGTLSGESLPSSAYETIVVDPAPSLVDYGECTWPLDTHALDSVWAGYDTFTQHWATRAASITLSRLTAYRVSPCPITLRPDLHSGACGLSAPVLGYPTPQFSPVLMGDRAYNVWYGQINKPCEVELPRPVVRIVEVKVDGDVVDPANYTVYNQHFLAWVGAGDCVWPKSQDFSKPDTAVGTFAVTYFNAVEVDAMGAWCAAKLAMEFAVAMAGGECALPSNVTAVVRSGVSYDLLAGAFPDGLTGIREVDNYIAQFNLKGRKPPTLFDPGAPVHRVVTS